MNWFRQNIYDWKDDSNQSANVAPAPAVNPAPAVQAPPVQTPVSTLDEGMIADVKRIVQRRSGSPFNALEENAATLVSVISDEVTRTKAAFAMLQKNGIAASSIISHIDLHIRDIESEKAVFKTTAQQAVAKKAGTLRTEASAMLDANKADEIQIKQLEEQILSMRTKIQERAGQAAQKVHEAEEAEADIQSKVIRFQTAADSVITTLNNKKASLSSTLA
jgi:hypothetical protein